jgi:hypothetical protein
MPYGPSHLGLFDLFAVAGQASCIYPQPGGTRPTLSPSLEYTAESTALKHLPAAIGYAAAMHARMHTCIAPCMHSTMHACLRAL